MTFTDAELTRVFRISHAVESVRGFLFTTEVGLDHLRELGVLEPRPPKPYTRPAGSRRSAKVRRAEERAEAARDMAYRSASTMVAGLRDLEDEIAFLRRRFERVENTGKLLVEPAPMTTR